MQYALLIHGPYNGNWLEEIIKNIIKFKYNFTKIILVSYTRDYELYKQKLKELKYKNIEIVQVKDILNPGFFNINRQLLCVKAGLKNIAGDIFVFKLRCDQSVDFNKIIKYISDDKILTTNCYSRVDRLYHPSDMFLAAKCSVLKEYYSLQPMDETHIMTELTNIQMCADDKNLSYVPIAPESMLCKNYLRIKGWNFKYSQDDSKEALKKYFIIMNSWNINFKSKRNRNNLLKKGSIILPHYFSALPFQDGPIENAKCYMYHNIAGSLPSIKDIFFLVLSKIIWFWWKNNLANPFYKYKLINKNEYRKIRRETLKIFPYFLVHKEIARLNSRIL